MKKTWIKYTLLLLAIVILGVAVGTALRVRTTTSPDTDADYLRLLSQVKEMIKQKYVEDIGDKKLAEGAVNGMLAVLDPHSAYLPPEFFKEMNIEISGSFGGLGIEINMTDGKLTVISPIDDTPAYRAGMKAGDFIWKIDDTFTRDLSINDAVKLMRGPKGTGVTLTIVRKGTARPLLVHLVRDTIKTKSLKSRTLEPGYGYIRIAHFQARTGDDFAAALAGLRKENGGTLHGLVIDLRNNPGGLLDAAVSVAGRFIDSKAANGAIVSTKGREPSSNMLLTTGFNDKEPAYPVVVLINGGSASASEIVAGALQDHRKAVIMGTQSFGKGSVQTIFPLPGGAGLKLTTARYYTPNGRSIQAKGITPDIIVENGAMPTSSRKAEPDFHEKDLANHITDGMKELPTTTPAPPPEQAVPAPKTDTDLKEKDNQLSRALALLKGVSALGKAK